MTHFLIRSFRVENSHEVRVGLRPPPETIHIHSLRHPPGPLSFPMAAKYDTIGVTYANLRQPDPRIAARIEAALGSAETVLNVGAGAGSYEPTGRKVTALDPSEKMIRQRPPTAVPCIKGVAENLPFPDKIFDASMAILTLHHWSDKARGLAEMRRVTRGAIVLLTFDPDAQDFWLCDYIPALSDLDKTIFPAVQDHKQWLGEIEVSPILVPADCTDGFLGAYWRRPYAYLDPKVRASISSFWAIGDVTEELARLKNDLDSGAWAERYQHLEKLDACDLGYRLVVSPAS